MLDNILGLVSEIAGNAVANNNNIPDNQKQNVAQVAAGALTSGLQNQLQSGGLSAITNLLSGNASGGSSIIDGLQQSVIGALGQKIGLSPAIAGSLATAIVPMAIKALTGKISDPNNSAFSVESVIGALTGGGGAKSSGGGLLGMLGGLFGK